jgi:hypothetical protein
MKWIVLALAGIVVLAGRNREAVACQTGRVFGARAPLFVLATARPDTVRTGPGTIEYNVRDSLDPSTIHGQLFRLDRVGGDVPPALAAARAAGINEAILVPYGWECRELWRWHGSARWVRPASQVIVDATLRPRASWIGERPTFDVEPLHDAYPGGYETLRGDERALRLTAAQVFELNEVLPTFGELDPPAVAPYRRLLLWAKANPALARRFPANEALSEAQEMLQPCVPAYDPHPVAGTYRITVVLERTDTLHGYIRTGKHGYPECAPARPRYDLTAVTPRRSSLSRLYVHGGTDPWAIPASNHEAFSAPGGCGVGSINVINRPKNPVLGERRWSADYNYLSIPGCTENAARVKQITNSLSAAYRQRGKTDLVPGTFREEPDGAVTFEQAWGVDGRVLLELRGTRVDRRTLDYN